MHEDENVVIFQQHNVGQNNVNELENEFGAWMEKYGDMIEIIERHVTLQIAEPIPGLEGVSGGPYTQITVFYKTK
ncbi:MAG: hypothetical protein HYT48_01840 [Candidatus Vogelbacteria bacterium]|nr:hypothetical protein [Candidatus Vogelbacteria bacterium]